MSQSLNHAQIEAIMMALADGKMINLDTPVRVVMQSVSSVLKKDPLGPVALHIVCCNEYGLVTP